MRVIARIIIALLGSAGAVQAAQLNNLVAQLLEVSSVTNSSQPFSFNRERDGWIFVSLETSDQRPVKLTLDKESHPESLILPEGRVREAMHYVTKGAHTLQLADGSSAEIRKLEVRAIPELIHCGLGFDPQIKSYGVYDLDFLKRDVLPNVTTLIVPNNIKLDDAVVEDWHRQGKRFVAEVGIDSQSKSADEHFKFWSGFFDRAPFLDGIIIDEFIVNRPVNEWVDHMTDERRARMEEEHRQYEACAEAFKKIRADARYSNKMVYAYVGGSGKKLNQEIIGTNVIRTTINCGYYIALERYLHEMSSEGGSKEALRTFVDGIGDWEAKEPGVKNRMVIAFGLFSMPSGSLNKQPNVDYHVWMDQQMNVVANHPALAGIGGLNWWTSLLADEETVRFAGKLYRHYAIEGRTNMLTSDPLFLTHIQNADFEKGTAGWTLHSAEEGSIVPKSFPRYGRIEGRFMGLGRPADPEHIGDTFLWMKRSANGPNTFSQTIDDLQPGRLYSMKMMVCDYNDLIAPKARKPEETKAIATIDIDGVDMDAKRSFSEVYSSSPEPKIPVCITYYWRVFRAKASTAKLSVSDWQTDQPSVFGQEQAFNFLEIQPYHE
jgi:hypothetical protein